MITSLHVKIIDAKCCGYRTCHDVCPELYKLDADGLAYVDDPLVPEGLELKARLGAEVCPQGAIILSDTPFDQ